MATEHPFSVVASELNYIVVFLHGITLGYPTQKLLTFILPLLAKISISCKCHKYRGRTQQGNPQVFSALRSLTAVFGMGTGVSS